MKNERNTCTRCGVELTNWNRGNYRDANGTVWCARCEDHLTYNNSGGWDEPDDDGWY